VKNDVFVAPLKEVVDCQDGVDRGLDKIFISVILENVDLTSSP